MSDTVKPDSLLMTVLFGHDDWREGLAENGGLSGNEVNSFKVDGDDGASEVFCPVSDFVRKVAADRFTPAVSRPITTAETLAKRAPQVAAKVERVGTWQMEFDAAGRLIRAKEIG